MDPIDDRLCQKSICLVDCFSTFLMKRYGCLAMEGLIVWSFGNRRMSARDLGLLDFSSFLNKRVTPQSSKDRVTLVGWTDEHFMTQD